MEDLRVQIKKILDGAKRIAILGVGSELRGDDAAGLLVVEKLAKKISGKRTVRFFFGGTAPENLSGQIKQYKPTHILIVDAADLGKKPGQIQLFQPQEVKGVSFCTHQLPLSIFADYMAQSLGCRVNIVGIQPKQLSFMHKPSKEVTASVLETVSAIFKALP